MLATKLDTSAVTIPLAIAGLFILPALWVALLQPEVRAETSAALTRRGRDRELLSVPRSAYSVDRHNYVEGMLSSVGGTPLAGAEVQLVDSRAFEADPEAPRRRALTDTRGRFRFEECGHSAFHLFVRADGYHAMRVANVAVGDGAPGRLGRLTLEPADDVEVLRLPVEWRSGSVRPRTARRA